MCAAEFVVDAVDGWDAVDLPKESALEIPLPRQDETQVTETR